MKAQNLFFSILILLVISTSLSATNVSGTISTNTTWSSAGSPYVVTSSVTVNTGVTLTIQSGVTVQFNDNYGMTVLGTLTATSVVFTSSSASPSAGKWTNITIGNSTYSGSASLASSQISYGSSINIVNGSFTTNGTDISNFSSYGIFINGTTTNGATANLTGGNLSNCGTCIYVNNYGSVITNGTNMSNSSNGVYFSSYSNLSTSTIKGGTISNMSTSAINSTNSVLDSITNVTLNGSCARGIYVSNANLILTGCTITSCTTPIEYSAASSIILNGTGNSFSGNSNKYVYMNHSSLSTSMALPSIAIPYYFPSGYTIYTGGRLQIGENNILKFGYYGINVSQGKLIANAGVGKNIYFTSFKDDNLGGDANGDASATAPSASDWTGIYFSSTAIDTACVLRRCTVKFASHGVDITSISPTLDSCTFSNNYHGVYISNNSHATINGCSFGSSSVTPIAQTFDADPIFTGNYFSFQDNLYDAIGLIGSSITANATLKIRSVTSKPNVTYVMLGDITIPSGISLTINKGIVIKSPANSYYKIVVLGTLTASGSVDSNIVMTSVRDDNSGGDTNKDGTLTSPTKGDFGGIVFATGSSNSSSLTYCNIRFANLNSTYYSNQYQNGGAVTMVNVSPTVSYCKISDCNIGIMCYQASNPTLSNTKIINSSSTPIAISVSANPTFTNDTFTNAGYIAIGIIGETVTVNGSLFKRNVFGYTNITYVLLGSLSIANGTTVEIQSGVVLKSIYYGISVDGGFKISGKPSDRVIVTSIKDDNVGNPFDTNGDGNATTPSVGDYANISYNSTSDDTYSVIRSTDIKFSGSGSYGSVTWNNAAAAMRDCNISNSNGMGLAFNGNSNPTIDSVNILNGNSDPIGMSLTSDPTFSNITFSANATKGIKILDATLSSNATLKKRSMAGISNIAYFISQLSISATATLTVQAGVVIKSNSSSYPYMIKIDGAIVGLGTATDKIVFTSVKDDSYGGDYNNDGNNTSPAKGDWYGLHFNNSSLNTTLKNCIFRYGSGYYNTGVIDFNSTTTATIDSSVIEQSSTPAVSSFGSTSSTVSNSQFLNIDNVPVLMSMFSSPTFTNISLSNVRDIGLGIISETYSQTASVPVRNFAGYTNVTYIGLGTYTVNSGTTITIPAGVVFKGGQWDVKGKLLVKGTASSPVVFTTVADDSYGNPYDTRQDGNLQDPMNNPSPQFLQFEDVSDDSSLVRNVIFRYCSNFYNSSASTACINLNSASPTIDSCVFQKSQVGVYLSGVSQPILNNNKFDNLVWNSIYSGYNRSGYPILTSILSYPSSTLNNTISGNNTCRGIGILNETLSQDVTLVKRNFAGFTNIPYIFSGFTVGSGATLTIAPGVVCKFTGGQLYVNKGLIAEGGSTFDSTIVFTSFQDDFYKGDTNGDSTYTIPSAYNWSGIVIDNQALNTLCRFKNVVVNYAYYGITTTSKSPSITYSLFKNNYEGVHMTGASNPIINYCDFIGNSNYGVNNVDKSFTVDARYCWWGNNTGPTYSTNTSGTGDKITDNVQYSPFRTIDAQNPIVGDVSLNGIVQAYDAALVLQKAVSLITFNSIQSRVGDVSGSAGITAYDASLILQFVVGKLNTFPAEILFKTEPAASHAELKMDNKTVASGQTFAVPVHLSKVLNALSLDIQFQYDPNVLDFAGITTGSYLQGLNIQQNIDAISGFIKLSVASTELLADNGDLILLTFKAKNIQLAKISTLINVSKFLANETDLKSTTIGSTIDVLGASTGIQLVNGLQLFKPYPNPFIESITIPYVLANSEPVLNIEVYSIIGKQVFTKAIENNPAGVSSFVWNGKNNEGESLGMGTYFVYIKVGNEQRIAKVMIVK